MKTDDGRAVADDLLAKIAIVKASIADIDKRCAEISLQALEDGDTEAQKGLAAFHKERAVRGARA